MFSIIVFLNCEIYILRPFFGFNIFLRFCASDGTSNSCRISVLAAEDAVVSAVRSMTDLGQLGSYALPQSRVTISTVGALVAGINNETMMDF